MAKSFRAKQGLINAKQHSHATGAKPMTWIDVKKLIAAIPKIFDKAGHIARLTHEILDDEQARAKIANTREFYPLINTLAQLKEHALAIEKDMLAKYTAGKKGMMTIEDVQFAIDTIYPQIMNAYQSVAQAYNLVANRLAINLGAAEAVIMQKYEAAASQKPELAQKAG